MIPYILSQVFGALAAASVVTFLYKAGEPMVIASVPKAFVAELLFSFALCYVVLNVATAKATANNHYFGLAIGGTVMAGAFAMGGISGGAFNPAVGLMPALFGMFVDGSPTPMAWIYAVGPVLGGIAAALVFKVMHPETAGGSSAAA